MLVRHMPKIIIIIFHRNKIIPALFRVLSKKLARNTFFQVLTAQQLSRKLLNPIQKVGNVEKRI